MLEFLPSDLYGWVLLIGGVFLLIKEAPPAFALLGRMWKELNLYARTRHLELRVDELESIDVLTAHDSRREP